MVKKRRGLKTGTRRKLAKSLRAKFKPETFLKEFKPGDRVIIKINPASNKGMPFSRFKGSTGCIKKKTNQGYVVQVKLGNKNKYLIVKPEHLKVQNRK